MRYNIIVGTLELTDNGQIRARVVFPSIAPEDGNEDTMVIGHAGSIDLYDFEPALEAELNKLTDRWADREAEMSRDEWHSELRADYYASVL